jgi:hypothetical protein
MSGDTPDNPFAPTDPPKKPDTPDPGVKPPDKPPDTPETPKTTVKAQDPETAKKEQAVNGGSAVVPLANAANQLASQATPLPQISLQLKYVDQKELRTFEAEYSSRRAVQRTYRPQGFFGLSDDVLAALPKNAFMEVDTNSEFWRKYEVTVHGPLGDDYTKLGLTSAVVQIDYGDPQGGTNRVTQSFGFNTPSAAGTTQLFSKPMYAGRYDYQSQLTYAFDGSWTGDFNTRTLAQPSSTVRDVYVNTQRDFKFVTVNAAFISPPDWNQVSQIHLAMTCSSLSATSPESFDKTVVIHSGWVPSLAPPDPTAPTPALPWKVRFKDADRKTPVRIAYRVKYVMRDGTQHESPSADTPDPTLVLDPAPRT